MTILPLLEVKYQGKDKNYLPNILPEWQKFSIFTPNFTYLI